MLLVPVEYKIRNGDNTERSSVEQDTHVNQAGSVRSIMVDLMRPSLSIRGPPLYRRINDHV